MTLLSCNHEHEILQAVRAGSLDASSQDHVNGCSICADAMLVAGFLQAKSQVAESEIHLPNADLIWWKAQLRTRHSAAERATRPIALVNKIGIISAVVAFFGFVLYSSQAQSWIDNFVHASWSMHSPYWDAMALVGGIGTLVCLLIGSFISLRD
jgi:hypothetical protein